MKNIKHSYKVGAAALKKGHVVKLTASLLVITAAATDDPIGVMLEDAAIGQAEALVCVGGRCDVLVESGVTDGEPLQVTTAGRADTHDGTTTQPVLGVARGTSTAQDELIQVDLPIGGFPGVAA